jgi:hypothetical protein
VAGLIVAIVSVNILLGIPDNLIEYVCCPQYDAAYAPDKLVNDCCP